MEAPTINFRHTNHEIAFRQLRSPESEEYIALHQICFPRMGNNGEQLRWWMFNDKFKNRCYVFVSEGRLIASLSFLPIKIRFGDSIKLGAIGANMMVHPEFRGQGLFHAMSSLSLKYEGELHGTSIVIGRTHLVPVYLKGGWTNPLELSYYAKQPSLDAAFDNRLKIISRFDSGFDKLLGEFYQHIRFGLIKSPDFLNFRIFEKPGVHYGVYGSVNRDDQVKGYIVFKKLYDVAHAVYKCHIVDVAALDYDVFSSLIDCVEYHNKDCSEINIPQPKGGAFEDFLLRKGFQRGSKYNFGDEWVVFDVEDLGAPFPDGLRHVVIADDDTW